MRPSETFAAPRIALLLHDFSPGGTERIAVRLAGLWAHQGRDVTILCGTQAGAIRDLVDDNIHVMSVAPIIPRSRGSRRKLGKAFAMLLEEHRFDAIVSPGNFHLPIIRAMHDPVKLSRTAILCKISNPLIRPERTRIEQRLFNWRTRRLACTADRIVAMSPTLRDEVVAVMGVGRVVTIAEPILPPGDGHRRANCDRRSGPMVVCAGRLVPQKRFDLALRAFATLKHQEAQLVMLGDGPERQQLEALTRHLGLVGRVRFAGHVPDIRPWLDHARALLLTSRFEGYPAVLVEAITAGVPVVTTRCSPAIDEILSDPSFGLAAEATAPAVARALEQILANDAVLEGPRAALALRHDAAQRAQEWLALIDAAVEQKQG